MEGTLKELIEELLALIPDADALARLADVAPDPDDLAALADVPGLPDDLRRALTAFCSAKRVQQLERVERMRRKLGSAVKVDDTDAARRAPPYQELLAVLQRSLPSDAEQALLSGLRAPPKVDPSFAAACCTPGQLAWMKQALLPPATLAAMAAAVLTPEQRQRLQASKLPRDVIARIEASRPKAEVVERHRAAAERVRAIEKSMLSDKKRARLDVTRSRQDDLREAAAAGAYEVRLRRMQDLAKRILAEVKP